nr:MAG: negative transcriptional regulator, PaiB family protein [Chloroflexota bacterium]
MYIPRAYREEDRDTLLAFMRAHSFITLVSILDGVPVASHVPVAVRVEGAAITLVGHLAKANPQHAAFGRGESLAIFSGPHAYISPSLYDKRESVPTWNYIAVHAYGVPRPVEVMAERAALEDGLRQLIATYEAAYQAQWDSLPAKFREGMLGGIVGFEMEVTRLEGKYKLSQNRHRADRERVAEALLQADDPAARATGAAMRATLGAPHQE